MQTCLTQFALATPVHYVTAGELSDRGTNWFEDPPEATPPLPHVR